MGELFSEHVPWDTVQDKDPLGWILFRTVGTFVHSVLFECCVVIKTSIWRRLKVDGCRWEDTGSHRLLTTHRSHRFTYKWLGKNFRSYPPE